MRADDFFAYAIERESIRLRRFVEGGPGPWSTDPVLQAYRFCNVDREDDAVTSWFAANVREPHRDNPEVLMATILFRWFNTVRTGQALFQNQGGTRDLTPFGKYLAFGTTKHLEWAIRDRMDGPPYTTGAYMIKTPAGMGKVEGVLWCVDQIRPKALDLARWMRYGGASLEAATAELCKFPFMGPFMAYEVVTDLRHTALLGSAPDIMTWANPGPGAARGLDRVFGGPGRNRNSAEHVAAMQVEMQQLLELSQDHGRWPGHWKPWEMRTVEHTLCEFDKYERARLGEGRPKQLFRKGEGK